MIQIVSVKNNNNKKSHLLMEVQEIDGKVSKIMLCSEILR